MAAERERFLTHVVNEGRAKVTILAMMRHTLLAAEMLTPRASTWVASPADLRWLADRWTETLPNRQGEGRSWAERRTAFLGHTRTWLSFLGRFKEEVPVHPFNADLEQFIEFERQERGLAATTCRGHRRIATEFFAWFASHVGADLSQLDISQVMAFVQQASFAGKSRVYASGGVAGLRVLLRWLVARGCCSKALVNCIHAPRLYAHERYPTGPTWSEVQALVQSAEGDSIRNLRDRAILLLLAIYGLRAGEVRALCLLDLDWENETLHPPRPKQRKVGVYPLTREMGDAIIAYLRVRPPCPHRGLFLSLLQPYHPLTSDAITSIVTHRQKRLGHKPKRFGAHGLRHASATYLLAEGFTLKQIGDHLGHTMIRATEAYAKVDLRSLRQVGEYSLAALIDCDRECAERETPFYPLGGLAALRLVAQISLPAML
jgi:site-specific recombinase XerD